MKQTNTILLEQVSALADGQLDDNASAHAIAQAGQAGEAQAAWHRYHLIGDVLRAGRHEQCTDTSAFVRRLQRSIALEPPNLMASPIPVLASALVRRPEAANESVFRWKMVASVASLAAAVSLGWGWAGTASVPAGAQLAEARQTQPENNSVLASSMSADTRWTPGIPTTVAVGTEAPQTMLRNARLDELLAAHQQAAGGLQPSVFLRNATFEGPSR